MTIDTFAEQAGDAAARDRGNRPLTSFTDHQNPVWSSVCWSCPEWMLKPRPFGERVAHSLDLLHRIAPNQAWNVSHFLSGRCAFASASQKIGTRKLLIWYKAEGSLDVSHFSSGAQNKLYGIRFIYDNRYILFGCMTIDTYIPISIVCRFRTSWRRRRPRSWRRAPRQSSSTCARSWRPRRKTTYPSPGKQHIRIPENNIPESRIPKPENRKTTYPSRKTQIAKPKSQNPNRNPNREIRIAKPKS